MRDPVRAIADAVLYEGYVLWPYRRSAHKNRQRWTWGAALPKAWSDAHPDDRWELSVECLVEGDDPEVDVRVRFLHIVRRQACDADGNPVDALRTATDMHLTWEEATERELGPGPFRIEAGEEREEVEGGSLLRTWDGLEGEVSLDVESAGEGLRKLAVTVANTAAWSGESREEALTRSLCSTHAVLRVEGGAFVSPLDPAAQGFRTDGLWPVLVGEPPDRSTLLASPIILEEYPRIAPESPGDLFDGGEIDQLLTLSILGLTDQEKEEMRASDPRTREILERTERLTVEDLMRLHGTFRDKR
jgi:hypothetical protein